ncbi:hypothetical protein TOPH_08212, partial [Tolypocladium ophioglossoides CBS 100239]
MESVDGIVNLVGIILGRCDGKSGAAHRGVGVSLHSHGHNYAVVAAAAAAEGPVEILVPRRRDNLKGEGVVGGQAVDGAERRVAAALDVAPGEANARTLAGHHNQAGLVRSLESLEPLDAGADLESLAGVVLVAPVDDPGVLEVMGPHGERSGAGGPAV